MCFSKANSLHKIIQFIVKMSYSMKAPNKKYFKRGDLAAKQEADYWSRHPRHVRQESVDAVEVRASYLHIFKLL